MVNKAGYIPCMTDHEVKGNHKHGFNKARFANKKILGLFGLVVILIIAFTKTNHMEKVQVYLKTGVVSDGLKSNNNGEDDDGYGDDIEVEPFHRPLDLLKLKLEGMDDKRSTEFQVERIKHEYGITTDSPYYSLDEMKAFVGSQCRGLRHMAVKTETNYPFRGGQWLPIHGDDTNIRFNPFDSWIYSFKGDERWAIRKNILFIGSSSSSAAKDVCNQRPDLFECATESIPRTLSEETNLIDRLIPLVDKFPKNHKVTIVFDWIDHGKEKQLTELILRVGNSLSNVERVVWVSQKFSNTYNVNQAIDTNQRMAEEIADVVSSHQPFAIQADDSSNKKGNIRHTDPSAYQVNLQDIQKDLKEYVFLDVRREPSGFKYFEEPSATLTLPDIEKGLVPNLNSKKKILVFCNDGDWSKRATKVLRLRGFENAICLKNGINAITPETVQSLDAPKPLSKTLLYGLDMFAPSLSIPESFGKDESNQMLNSFLTDAIMNLVFQDQILLRSSNTDASTHVCQSDQDCTSCFLVPSKVPSSRMTFDVIANYFNQQKVPTIITLTSDQKIWDGSWERFVKENADKTLRVRKGDYSTTKTRKFTRQRLDKYLVEAKIVRKLNDGTYRATTRAEHEADKSEGLPIYAGNNKLGMQTMRSFHFKYPGWINRASLEKPAMWLGPVGSMSSLHDDHLNQGNLAYQVLGTKKWHLFPYRTKPFMYLKRSGVVLWSSIIDPGVYNREDEKKYPLFKLALADSIILELKQGECLFNPSHMFHIVYNTDSSLMLNFWMKRGREILPVDN